MIWLLDGLNEIPTWADVVGRQVQHLPGLLVLTSRKVGYLSIDLIDIPRFEIIPFTENKVSLFVRKWFSIIAETTHQDDNWIRERIAWLEAQWDAHPGVRDLTINPLLLTFMVILANESPLRELPSNRAELYRRYLDELFTTWELSHQSYLSEGTNITSIIDSTKKTKGRRSFIYGINLLGWLLHSKYYGSKSEQTLTKEELQNLLRMYQLIFVGDQDDVSPEEILNYWIQAGLLEESNVRGRTYISFIHLTFQEYGSAWGLAKAWENNISQAWKFLRPRLHDPAWREPILMMSTILDQKQFDLLAKKILRAYSRFEDILFRDILLLGELLVERRFAQGIDNGRYDKTIISRLGNLLLQPYPDPNEITDILERLQPKANLTLIKCLETRYSESFDQVITTIARLLRGDALAYIYPYYEMAMNFYLQQIYVYRLTQSVIHALGETRDPEVVSLLVSLPGYDAGMIGDMIIALGEIDDPSVLPILLQRFQYTGKSNLKEAAIETLGGFDPAKVIPFLESSATDPEYEHSAKRILGFINLRQKMNQLENILDELSEREQPPSAAKDLVLAIFDDLDIGSINTSMEVIQIIRRIPFQYLETLEHEYINIKGQNDSIHGLLNTINSPDIDDDAEYSNEYFLEALHSPDSYNRFRAARELTKRRVLKALPEIIDLINKERLDWGELTISNLVRLQSNASEIKKILAMLIRKHSRQFALYSLVNPNFSFFNFLKETLKFLMTIPSIREIQGAWMFLINKLSEGKSERYISLYYSFSNSFYDLKDIANKLDSLESRARDISDPLLLEPRFKIYLNIWQRRLLLAFCGTILEILNIFIPKFISIQLSLITQIVIAIIIFIIFFGFEFLIESFK